MLKTCPEPTSVRAFALGTLRGEEVSALSDHLDACGECRAEYEKHRRQGDPVLAGLRFTQRDDCNPHVQQIAEKLLAIPFEQSGGAAIHAADIETSVAAEQTAEFNPLHVWLGIPPDEPSPDHYRLLGIRKFEGNAEVIEMAADRQMAHLRNFASGRHADLAQSLLDQVDAARTCLLDAHEKAVYDQQLKQRAPIDDQPPSKVTLPAGPARTVEEFRQIAVGLGLISAKKLDGYCVEAFPDRRPTNAQTLARQLVADGRLLEHQANAICDGRWRELVLGEYTLLERIGGGGMGDVHKALHRRMGVTRAIKVIKRELVDSPDAERRFHREVLTAAQLSHPNIVLAYDAGDDQGRHYLVMEYIDGPDLGRLVKERGPLSVPLALNYVIQTARGLAYAHQKGTIHRDVKPGNLLLDSSGTVKVSDLGLARLDPEKCPVECDIYLTTSEGKILGTVDFMAPEQAENTHTVDHRADIYSLGCTLYRLLTGKSPYGQGSSIHRMMSHCSAPIPKLRAERIDVPEALDAVFARMIAKRPEDRPQSMEEVVDLLQAFVSPPASAAPALPAKQPPIADSAAMPLLVAEQPHVRLLREKQALRKQLGARLGSRNSSAIIAGGLALLLAMLGGGAAAAVVVYRIATDKGELVIKTDDPDVEVRVTQGGEVVTIIDLKSQQQVTLNAGEYGISLGDEASGLRLSTDKFTLKRGEKKIVDVTSTGPGSASTATSTAETSAAVRVLIDASKDGGLWWFPQAPPTFDAAKHHQGKPLADLLRTKGWEVHELPRDMRDVSATLDSSKFDVVMRIGEYGRQSEGEAEAYRNYVERGGSLLLVMRSSLKLDTDDDLIARALGITFDDGRVAKKISWPESSRQRFWLRDTPDSLAQVRTWTHGKGKVLVLTTYDSLIFSLQPTVVDKFCAFLTGAEVADESSPEESAEPDESTKPELLEPAEAARLDNGSIDRADPIVWNFDWSDVPDATDYHLFVISAGAGSPSVDRRTLRESAYEHRSEGSYIASHNAKGWLWKVRAKVNGQWGAWSEERTFDVEPAAASGTKEP